MQTNIITKEKKFEPIEVTFVIESKRELEAFISVFNANEKNFMDFVNAHKLQDVSEFKPGETVIMPVDKWSALNNIYNLLPVSFALILSLASFWNEIKTIGLHIMAGA